MRRDLVQRAMAHDHEAFSELVRLSVDQPYAVGRLILREPEWAEDATLARSTEESFYADQGICLMAPDGSGPHSVSVGSAPLRITPAGRPFPTGVMVRVPPRVSGRRSP